jgi:hypothetical protein
MKLSLADRKQAETFREVLELMRAHPDSIKTRKFQLRNIPPKLHESWRTIAAANDVSMEILCYIALNNFFRGVFTTAAIEIEQTMDQVFEELLHNDD